MIGLIIGEQSTRVELAPIYARGYWLAFRVPIGSDKHWGEYGVAFTWGRYGPVAWWHWGNSCYPRDARNAWQWLRRRFA
jgi:hypothetical protein